MRLTVAPALYHAMAVSPKQRIRSPVKVSPKQRISPVKVKRGRPPKLFRKKVPVLEKMTVNQLISHEKEKAQSHKRKRAANDDSYRNGEIKSAAMEGALEVQANLSPKFPCMIKHMLPSHVAGGFWLGLPKPFCSKHLPKEDRMMVLEDENGEEFEAKYLVEKTGLSGGWRGFSIAHKLLEGDVCVFHLVKPSKFKVYIVRRKGSDEVDVALGLLKLESSTEQFDLGKEHKICENIIDKPLKNYGMHGNMLSEEKTCKISEEVLPLDISQNDIHLMISEGKENGSKLGPTAYQSENDGEDPGSEVSDGIRLADSIVDFGQVKNFEDFNMHVNGLIIDSELSNYLHAKYYELCSSQKSFLHDNLLEGLNCKLVAGVISETINIADAIRAAKLTTSHHNFLTWDQTLKSFEGLGMKVGFLRARLEQMMNLSAKSMRYQEARLEQVGANEEKKKLEAKLVEITEALDKLVES